MKRFSLLLVLLAPLIIHAQKPEMETRFYPVDPARWQAVIPAEDDDPFGDGNPSSERFSLTNIFKTFGVEFPEGSSIHYEPMIAQLVATNTPENLEKLEEILSKSGVDAREVYVDVWAVNFDVDVVREHERNLGRPLQDNEYFSLWKEGKGERVFSQGVRTVNGVNAVLKSTTAQNSESSPGTVLNVTPTVGARGEINLVILPTHQAPGPDGKKDPAQGALWELTTSVILTDGSSSVLGHSTTVDGNQRTVFFVSARSVGVFWKKK